MRRHSRLLETFGPDRLGIADGEEREGVQFFGAFPRKATKQVVRSSDCVNDERDNGTRCHPLAPIPAWWSGFLFHALNPRQVCMFTYLTMIADHEGTCSPTIEEIREDLGLYSTSMVFEALAVLDDLCFIIRERRTFPGSRAKRNLYRRPPCESTLLKLLERNVIDEHLRPLGNHAAPAAAEARALVREGLQDLLGDRFPRYDEAAPENKRATLVEILQKLLDEREPSRS
jgi:hypothetical protein